MSVNHRIFRVSKKERKIKMSHIAYIYNLSWNATLHYICCNIYIKCLDFHSTTRPYIFSLLYIWVMVSDGFNYCTYDFIVRPLPLPEPLHSPASDLILFYGNFLKNLVLSAVESQNFSISWDTFLFCMCKAKVYL